MPNEKKDESIATQGKMLLITDASHQPAPHCQT